MKKQYQFFSKRIKLYISLVASLVLYGLETHLTAETRRRRQVFECTCFRKSMHIFSLDHNTNVDIRDKVKNNFFRSECRKLVWFEHVTRNDKLQINSPMSSGGRMKKRRLIKTWNDSRTGQWRPGTCGCPEPTHMKLFD